MKVALAIFVKTPGPSKVKTRLAATLGEKAAVQFYQLSVQAMAAVGRHLRQQISGLDVYWAVAEASTLNDPLWSAFPTVYQGEGNLGERLHQIYSTLIQTHDVVALVGADSPHISVSHWQDALLAAMRTDGFHMGETEDGGFYFFGGRDPVPRGIWTSVSYSQDDTAASLGAKIATIGRLQLGWRDFDIDTVEDLLKYKGSAFAALGLPEQRRLVDWAKRNLPL